MPHPSIIACDIGLSIEQVCNRARMSEWEQRPPSIRRRCLNDLTLHVSGHDACLLHGFGCLWELFWTQEELVKRDAAEKSGLHEKCWTASFRALDKGVQRLDQMQSRSPCHVRLIQIVWQRERDSFQLVDEIRLNARGWVEACTACRCVCYSVTE
jgi:hypothetical protein